MKKIVLFFPLLGLLGLSLAARDFTVEKKEDIQKTLRFQDPSKPREVLVDNIFGAITVEGTSGQDVLLVAHKTIRASSQERLQKALEEVKLDITEKGNSVDIYVDGPFRCHDRRGHSDRRDLGYEVQYDFELKVPLKTNLDISTVNRGEITIRSVDGSFAVNNVNGGIRMTAVAGTGEAHTVNGKIQATFERAPNGNCSFETVNGELELTFPENLSADFRMKTFNGDAYSDFPVTYLQGTNLLAGAAPMKEWQKGKFIYKSDQFFSVRTGKGGPQITLETLNGDILIKKRTS